MSNQVTEEGGLSDVQRPNGHGRPLDGRVAVVTGGNHGLGRSIALSLAGAGARVAISARSRESLRDTEAELRRLNRDSLAITADVRDSASTDAMAATVLDHYGRIDVVVANAGIAGPIKPMHEIEFDEWRDCLSTDLDGVYLTFRRFVRPMIDKRSGCLIAISSAVGKMPIKERTPYCAAKLGLIGLTRSLALELGPFGIRVNTICPGSVAGDRLDRIVHQNAEAHGITDEEALRNFSAAHALKRPVDPREVGAACVFLASDAASGITGEDLNVSAGLIMY